MRVEEGRRAEGTRQEGTWSTSPGLTPEEPWVASSHKGGCAPIKSGCVPLGPAAPLHALCLPSARETEFCHCLLARLPCQGLSATLFLVSWSPRYGGRGGSLAGKQGAPEIGLC